MVSSPDIHTASALKLEFCLRPRCMQTGFMPNLRNYLIQNTRAERLLKATQRGGGSNR
jgi:hypothetical protein